MLRHIIVRDFAVIDTLDVELASGMTALTGETGAGKSILIDVIGLLLGDRGDAGSVRQGAVQADLAAEFELGPGHPAQAWLQEQSLAEPEQPVNSEDTGTVLLRRVITVQGKSRAWINGRPVTMTQLRTLGEWLVDIHGQHAHQQMLSRPAQRRLLDGFVDAGLRQAVAEAFRTLADARERLQAARSGLADAADRVDLLRFQSAEIAELAPTSGEHAALVSEQALLAHATEVLAALQEAGEVLDGEDGIDQGLGRALSRLHDAARHDARLGPALELLDSARIQVQEAGDGLRRLADRTEIDPQRLAELDTRLGEYLRLSRKHRVEPDDLAELLQRMENELEAIDSGDAHLAHLENEEAAAATHYDQAAAALGIARRHAAARLDASVTQAMQELGMPGGRFRIDVRERGDEGGPEGRDRVEFLVSANPGFELQPVAQVASGGELSRIGLAFQVIASEAQSVDTLIFDEVDSGISGAVAEVVGRRLRALGSRHQVLCVTHLAQVAAQAHHQIQVSKRKAAGGMRTEVTCLDATGRVEAIAGMLGGIRLTERSRGHAREMLETAAAPDPSVEG